VGEGWRASEAGSGSCRSRVADLVGGRPSPAAWTSPKRRAPPASPPAFKGAWRTTHCLRGEVAEGLAILKRARELAEAAGDGEALLEVAVAESDILLKTGRFDQAAEAGLRGLQVAREYGRHTSIGAYVVASNAAEAMLARGRTADAAQLIDPLTDEPAAPIVTSAHCARRDRSAARRRRGRRVAAAADQIRHRPDSSDDACEIAQRAADVAIWAGGPRTVLAEVREVLATYESTDWASSGGGCW
jgi:hypothetical protein